MTMQEQIYWWREQELIQAARGDDTSLFHAATAKAKWQELTGSRVWTEEHLRWPLPRYDRNAHMSGLTDKDPRKQQWLYEQQIEQDAMQTLA